MPAGSKKRKEPKYDDLDSVDTEEELPKRSRKRRAISNQSSGSDSVTQTPEPIMFEVKREPMVAQSLPLIPEEMNASLVQMRDSLHAQVAELVKECRAQLDLIATATDSQVNKIREKLNWIETGKQYVCSWDLNVENEFRSYEISALQGKLLLLQSMKEQISQQQNNVSMGKEDLPVLLDFSLK